MAFSCGKCGKQLKTENGRKLHQQTCGAKPSAKRKKSAPSRAAPVSNPSRHVKVQSKDEFTTWTTGERVKTYDIAANASTGTEVFTIHVGGGMTERLSQLALAFQKIRFNSVSIQITAKAPTSVSGGYLAAFVSDPDDSVGLEMLSQQKGGVNKKWWENSTVSMTKSAGLTAYYTRVGKTDERWTSPGKFVCMVDGKPNSSISLTVSLSWNVTFMVPSLESKVTQEPAYFAIADLCVRQNSRNLVLWSNPSKTYSVDAMFSGSPPPGVYQIEGFNIEYSEGTGDTGTYQVCYLQVSDNRTKVEAMRTTTELLPADYYWQSNVDHQICMPRGARIWPLVTKVFHNPPRAVTILSSV